MVKWLAENGANVGAKDKEGWTAFHMAENADYFKKEIQRYLKSKEAKKGSEL